MSQEDLDIATFKHIREVLSWVLTQLDEFQPPREQLADYIPASRFLGIPRRAKMIHVGDAWHLGLFLMAQDGQLFQAGKTTRAVTPGHPGHVSNSQEERRGFRDAAFRGPFPEGSVVNFDTYLIDMDMQELRHSEHALFVKDGVALVRWRPGATDDEAMPFKEYMAERLELLLNPPARATD